MWLLLRRDVEDEEPDDATGRLHSRRPLSGVSGLASAMGTGMMTRFSYKGDAVASKDKGGKSEKKRPQKNLKEKRADKKQKKAK